MNKKEQFKEISKELDRWRRHLPHYQVGGKTLFVTWRCLGGITLSAQERAIVLDCVRQFQQQRYLVFAAVIMPDHVHILIEPLEREPGIWWDLGQLLKGMKGVSARRINKLRSINGSVWQDERFDRLIRTETDFIEKWNYIRMNPVKRGLVSEPDDWDALWLPELTGELRWR
ncbi:MAG: transposase [Planctomycetota bacterium]|nr:transposase [Planctomycetota bacterium]